MHNVLLFPARGIASIATREERVDQVTRSSPAFKPREKFGTQTLAEVIGSASGGA